MTVVFPSTAFASGILYTASRNPSAAARVSRSPSNSMLMPVRTGRDSSVAAAMETREIPSRNPSAPISAVIPSATSGTGGKSSASIPFTCAWKRPQVNCTVRPPAGISMWTSSLGRELTNSPSRRAGTVMLPCSSTLAPTQQVVAISRFVATSFRRDSSATRSIFWATGNVDRTATDRPTIPRPRLRFSCRHETLMHLPPRIREPNHTIGFYHRQ